MTLDALEAMLEASRKDFAESVAAIPDAHGSTKPYPESWSALECVEHVAVVEERFLGRLNAATPAVPEPKRDQQHEAHIAALIGNRGVRAKAPEPAQPTGRFATLPEALDAFHNVRSRTIEFARARHADLYGLGMEHARFGPLNGVEYMIVIAGHARRHAEQLREIAAAHASQERGAGLSSAQPAR